MKNSRVVLTAGTLLALTTIFPANVSAEENIPSGWMKSGTNANGYIINIERDEAYVGNQSVSITSVEDNTNIDGLVGLTQFADAEPYKGKRLKVTFYIKGEPVTGGAGLIVQTYDNKESITEIASTMYSTNKESEDISNWKASSVVIHVPESSSKIAYGGFLKGQGKIWFDNVSLETVSDDVALTNKGDENE